MATAGTIIASAAGFPRRNDAEMDFAIRRLLLYEISLIDQSNINQELSMIDLYHTDSMLV